LIFYHFGENTSEKQVEICLYDNWGMLRFLDPGEHIFRKKQGRTVSFFSFREVRNLTMKGFRYNLKSQSYINFFGGLSNVYEAEECLLKFRGNRMIWYECYEQ